MFLVILLISIGLAAAKQESESIARRRYELEECDELIPHFIDQINENNLNGECEEIGEFPKPGDCTVFFRCVRGRGRILPFLEYCAIGYTFDGVGCISNSNNTDCPQFNCTAAPKTNISIEKISNSTDLKDIKFIENGKEQNSKDSSVLEFNDGNDINTESTVNSSQEVVKDGALTSHNYKDVNYKQIKQDSENNVDTFSAAHLQKNGVREEEIQQLNSGVNLNYSNLFVLISGIIAIQIVQ